MSYHPMHPTRHDWWASCPLCPAMVCIDCGHSRQWHSHQQGCLAISSCLCRNKKRDTVAFRDPQLILPTDVDITPDDQEGERLRVGDEILPLGAVGRRRPGMTMAEAVAAVDALAAKLRELAAE